MGRCLEALLVAVAAAVAVRPALEAVMVVAADRCRDRTADVARAAGALVCELDVGSVGVARGAGVQVGLTALPSRTGTGAGTGKGGGEDTWVASTDADTQVPARWVARHLDLAATGARLVTGRAVPEHATFDADGWRDWRHQHPEGEAHRRVHGANLGFRLDAYQSVGGWPALRENEDLALVTAFYGIGVVPQGGLDVTTSGRRDGRTPGGFAAYLRRLDAITVRERA